MSCGFNFAYENGPQLWSCRLRFSAQKHYNTMIAAQSPMILEVAVVSAEWNMHNVVYPLKNIILLWMVTVFPNTRTILHYHPSRNPYQCKSNNRCQYGEQECLIGS